MEIIKIPVGVYQTNCYLIKNNKEVIIIDPGANANRIQSYMHEQEKVCAICLTHGHFDHIGAVDELQKLYDCPVYASKEEKDIYSDYEKNYSQSKKISLKSNVMDYEDTLVINSFKFNIYETPGHSPGSVCLEIENFLFTGDTLFKQSVGRTDLYGSNNSDLKQSLKLIKTLDPDLIIYPGHEMSSTLREELASNPYLK